MALITLEKAARYYGDRPIFTDVSFTVNEGDRIGLVGVNGGGKSTLLEVIAESLRLDQGQRRARRGLRIGYLEQMADLDVDRTAYEEALLGASAARNLEGELRSLESAMAEGGGAETLTRLAARHAEVLDRFQRAGGEGYERFVDTALSGLGLPRMCWHRRLGDLSSGQRVRVKLARMLQGDFDLMLLDEPTNHLDVEGIGWLAETLAQRGTALVVVSHDRYFLDRVVTRVMELDRTHLHFYPGSFSGYLPTRTLRLKTALRSFEKQEEMIRKNEEFVRRAAHGNKPGVAQSRKKMLAKVERLDRPTEVPALKIRIDAEDISSRELLTARDVTVGYPGHPALFQGLTLHIAGGDRIGIIGPNGSGKTTFMKVLAGTVAPQSGEVWQSSRMKMSYYDQELEGLDTKATLLEEVQRAESTLTEGQARGRLGGFGFSGDAVFRTVSTLSGGEQGRLSLLKVILQGGNLLLLDEPTNHLDVFTRQSFLDALNAYPGTVIMVTHDRHLLDAWAHRIVRIDGAASVVRKGNYSDFEAWWEAEKSAAASHAAGAVKQPRKKPAKKVPAPARKKRRFWKLEALEAAIMEKEARIRKAEASFADPQVARDGERMKRLLKETEAMKAELQDLNEEWETWAE